MIYGYARISTPSQSIERQIRNIRTEAPEISDKNIFREAFTGKVMNRPEWNKLFKKVTEGDVIIFDSVSRMARNADEGIAAYLELMGRGVELRFIKEPSINTETYKSAEETQLPAIETGNADEDELANGVIDAIKRYMKKLAARQIRLAFEQSQKEVDDLRQRTREGMETAKLEGHVAGRKVGSTVETKKAKEAKGIILTHSKTFGGSLDDEECRKLTGVSRNSYYKYKAELKEEAV